MYGKGPDHSAGMDVTARWRHTLALTVQKSGLMRRRLMAACSGDAKSNAVMPNVFQREGLFEKQARSYSFQTFDFGWFSDVDFK